MTDRFCPVCGDKNINTVKNYREIKEPFAGQKTLELDEYSCSTCESTGDFFDDNELVISECIKSLKKDAAANILTDFAEKNINFAAIERALELPQRTLTKWKNKLRGIKINDGIVSSKIDGA